MYDRKYSKDMRNLSKCLRLNSQACRQGRIKDNSLSKDNFRSNNIHTQSMTDISCNTRCKPSIDLLLYFRNMRQGMSRMSYSKKKYHSHKRYNLQQNRKYSNSPYNLHTNNSIDKLC
jgi:hypothetical protein